SCQDRFMNLNLWIQKRPWTSICVFLMNFQRPFFLNPYGIIFARYSRQKA
ncbi:uncharacterized protein METZ01_LOCUS231192, partial [marine metagenome]